MSRWLADRSIDHVVLERGEVAHTWRTERWDSLRLLTPNWQSRLPGFGYNGEEMARYYRLYMPFASGAEKTQLQKYLDQFDSQRK